MATFKIKEQYGPRGELVLVEVKADYMKTDLGELQLWARKEKNSGAILVYTSGSCKWVSCEKVEEDA